MAEVHDEDGVPSIRFKRRKVAHPKRPQIELGSPKSAPPSAIVADSNSTPSTATPDAYIEDGDDDSLPNLKEILRNRRRPRDRPREAARKPETPRAEVVQHGGESQPQFTSRFVAQTGQVVDRDDKQMSKYVEARLAEQNYRKYGWPIPPHLQVLVAEIAPDLKPSFTATSPKQESVVQPQTSADIDKSIRMAAGQGKIEEVELDPDAAHTGTRWQQLHNGDTGKVRLGRDGKPRRYPKRRNSHDLKRDEMVEAVFREAKLDFFDAVVPANPTNTGTGDNDEALLEKFRTEYFESVAEAKQQQRKPAQPAKGAEKVSRGPKMGGSKSVRARMMREEQQAARAKK